MTGPSDDGKGPSWATRPDLQAALEEQAARWRRGERVPAEEWLARHASLAADAEAALDLIGNEVLLRQERGDRAEPEEYLERFPQWATQIRAFFEVERALQEETSGVPATWQPGRSTPAQTEPLAPGRLPSVPGYEVLGVLGQGGMGVVYRARQSGLGRVVALKMLRAGAHAGPDEVARFRREAEAVARLQHPNVVQIFEVGEHDGLPFFSLELVEGGTLEKFRGAALPPREAARTAEVLARAVHQAHLAGVIHRDLKPANVLLARDGTPKITDFGLAKRLEGEAHTHSGAVMGTPSYMAPEQARGDSRRVGPAADTYALGAILYELLTGSPPFVAENPLDVLVRVLADEPVRPSRLRPGLPHDLEVICLKCLEKDPARRYGSAEALADDLARFQAGRPILARATPWWERTARLMRRRPRSASGLAVAVLMLLACAGYALWHWDRHYRLKVEHYANYVKRWGAPEGIGPVAQDQLARRGLTYRLYRRGGHVEKMEIVNGHGHLTTLHDVPVLIGDLPAGDDRDTQQRHECRFEYKRNSKGEVTEEVGSDQHGNVIWTFHYTTPTTGHFTDARGFPSPRAGSGAAYVEVEYSTDGFEKEIHYLDRNGKPRPNRYGYYGERREFDPRGLPERVVYLDAPGQSGAYEAGSLVSTATYDGQGNRLELAYFDPSGTPILVADGYARVTHSYDGYGNWTERAYFDRDGRPVLSNERVARIVLRHDDHGNAIEVRHFGADGELTLNQDHVAACTARYDGRGRLTGGAWFGVDGKPTLHRGGFASVEMVIDERGNPTDVSLFGVDGKPATNRQGYARLTKKYDARGNVTEAVLFGVDGRPTLDKQGYCRKVLVYDDQGRLREVSFFGTDGKPALFLQSYARIRYEHDERGHVREIVFFGLDGEPAVHRDGYSRWTARYDEIGDRTEVAYFGLNGKPALYKDGYARRVGRYGRGGKEIEVRYYGLDDRPTLSIDGTAGYTASYDQRGNPIEEAHFGADGKPALFRGQFATLALKHDERNNRIQEAYFGPDGKPILVNGFCSATMKYDQRGNKVEERYFGPDGKPTSHAEGYARITWTYDSRNNIAEQVFFDARGKPFLVADGFARVTYVWDARGNLTEEACHGIDGKPASNKQGYARRTAKFSPNDAQIDAAYFDVDGKPLRVEVVVAEVVPGSQAERLGLRVGDVLVEHDNQGIVNTFRFVASRQQDEKRQPTELHALRDGRRIRFLVGPGKLGAVLEDRVSR
jgi:hypothetical protein